MNPVLDSNGIQLDSMDVCHGRKTYLVPSSSAAQWLILMYFYVYVCVFGIFETIKHSR